ncbi:MAG: GH92 family glycosyl hydrolase, partial [Bacteroidota bacterium]|nr:GH92 family glycosyl hydrolase [Bacteroidota bacterium]
PLNVISHRSGEMFGIMPVSGEVHPSQWFSGSEYDHDQETATPYYYQVLLENDNINVEYSPGSKGGCFRFSFPAGGKENILLSVLQNGKLKVSGSAVEGTESFNSMQAWFYGEFSEEGVAQIVKDQKIELGNQTEGSQCKVILSFDAAKGKKLEFRYAISYIGPEQARVNFHYDISKESFDQIAQKAKKIWQQALDKIEVSGGDDAQRRTFYTALYRCYERMVNINEYGQYYSGFDGRVHQANRDFYVDDWSWDTHLALHPLRVILDPKIESDMIQSYVSMYEQTSWMPSFPLLWGDNPCMTGNHAAAIIADAWFKGVRNFDVVKAYEGLRRNATEATMLPWRNGKMCRLDSFYVDHGYYPALKPGEKETEEMVHGFEKRQAVSLTLTQSFDDWNLARLAKEMGHQDDYSKFLKRSAYYKNVYNQEKGFMWPRTEDGKWIENFDPKFSGGPGGRDYFTECNAWTYNWYVQHDIPGLINLMGGRTAFISKLDQLFREGLDRSKYEYWAKFPDATGLVGQYVMGNEPSFHIPYLYDYAGAPWKTQKRIRMLMDTWFMNNIFGICGDEDGGGMSAFYVFSAMGFYPVTPGFPIYAIGSPLFEKVTIHLEGGKTFTVKANKCSRVNKYIQSAMLNGKPLNKPW